MAYMVERDEVYNGLRCVVIFAEMGHRCGYVGVSETHPLYGIEYSQVIPLSLREKWEKVKKGTIGKRGVISLVTCDDEAPRLDCLFDVHGSLTYSGDGKRKYPVEAENTWWFGFDCAHCDDGKDFAAAEKYGFKIHSFWREEGIPRSLEYAWQECKNLADQLVEV